MLVFLQETTTSVGYSAVTSIKPMSLANSPRYQGGHFIGGIAGITGDVLSFGLHALGPPPEYAAAGWGFSYLWEYHDKLPVLGNHDNVSYYVRTCIFVKNKKLYQM